MAQLYQVSLTMGGGGREGVFFWADIQLGKFLDIYYRGSMQHIHCTSTKTIVKTLRVAVLLVSDPQTKKSYCYLNRQ